MTANTDMFKVIVPATDWYFVHESTMPGEPRNVWPLAVWALKESGEVIGLVGAFGHHQATQTNSAPTLASIPPVPGEYVHWNQLTEAEQTKVQTSKR